MEDPWWIAFVLGCFALLTGGFITVFVMFVRYSLSVWRLVQDLQTLDQALWISLGRPDIFTFSPGLRSLAAPGTLYAWCMGGAEGATSELVRTRAEEALRWYRLSIRSFIAYSVGSMLIFVSLASLAPKPSGSNVPVEGVGNSLTVQ